MRFVALCFALTIRLSAQPDAEEVLRTARAALGARLSSAQAISLWGAYRQGGRSSTIALTIDLSGKCLREQTTFSTGGQIQRTGSEGVAGGGMPGDDGGPAMSLNLTEGFDGDDYWARNGTGSGKQAFVHAFVRYVLALTLSPPANFPVSFRYGGRIESPRGVVDAIEGKGANGFLVHLYLDADGHMPMTMVYREGAEEIQLWLKDYRSEDGIRFPHTMTWMAGGEAVEELQIQHLKVNPKLRPVKFRR
jgi:hypothetical protein